MEQSSFDVTREPRRVMIAMSGGVDSAVAAYLLKRDGYDTLGVTLQMFERELLTPEAQRALPRSSPIDDARDAADRLGIPHRALNFSNEFCASVVEPFIETYRAGGTPNPCVECNRCLKFGKLLDAADALGFPYLATGHYSKIERESGGRYILRRAEDMNKDQTYMLWSLSQEQLSRVLFPLGGMTKNEVREIAGSLGFVSANRKDSQDICFIPDGDYAAFIKHHTGESFPEGDFLDESGNCLGRHKGIIHYTVGQRKGLGIALGEPMYVSKKDAAKNTVTLARNEGLFRRTLKVERANLMLWDRLDSPVRVTAKVRYHHTPVPATVTQIADDRLFVEFDEPVRAIAPGQSFVMYEGDYLAGGGIISDE